MHAKTSGLTYFAASFCVLLALRFASSTYLKEASDLHRTQTPITGQCSTVDQPNPIASIYPNNATGVLNGTIAVLPITLELARQLIPPQYRILEHAYRHLLPDFPPGMYPAIVQALHDHEVQAFGYKIDDFTRTGMEFPFVDLLNDNHTSFKWAPSLLMTSTQDIALKGAAEYGVSTFPATFDPPCDAYRSVPDSAATGTTSFSAIASNGSECLVTLFSSSPSSTTSHAKPLYPLHFFKNATNQPIFADGKTCDNMIRLFDTSLSKAPFQIERVTGTVKVSMFPLREEKEWTGVQGLRFASAFIENNYLECATFAGYSTFP